MRLHRLALGLGIGGLLSCLAMASRTLAVDPLPSEKILVGKDLFFREWVPGDPRARGGDGLGPVYNASSCVACHFLGGAGGAGPNDRNAEIATASLLNVQNPNAKEPSRELLIKTHPGFRNASGVVLHSHGVGEDYEPWRKNLLAWNYGDFRLSVTKRNTPALFGVGKIDSILEMEIRRMALLSHPEAPEIQGRLSRLPDGRLGRFGWKGQTASLDDFVRTACAVELGLEVSGHPQSPNPADFDAKAPGFDLSDAECSAMVAYVSNLREPSLRPPFSSDQEKAEIEGRHQFAAIGCAACHSYAIGNVEGIYSDLLLHDMGPNLVDSGVYYGSPAPPPTNLASKTVPTLGEPAKEREWRTPPLWGLRDSAPYLHDGRATTFEIAIVAHGGEAQLTVDRYRKLEAIQRNQIHSFLNSLTAPRPEKEAKANKAVKANRSAPVARAGFSR